MNHIYKFTCKFESGSTMECVVEAKNWTAAHKKLGEEYPETSEVSSGTFKMVRKRKRKVKA
jgi:hypothetical protein